MKRLLCALVLLLVLGSVAAPFAEAKADFKDKWTVSEKRTTFTKYSGLSKLEVEPAKTATGITVTVEQRPSEVEYNWVLSQKPTTNTFKLELTLTNCNYYYQPPLTSEYTTESAAKEFGEPCTVTATAVTGKSGKVYVSRPENVVGSYAVYSDYSDGVYGTGKITHIYRPLVTDAKGKTTWAEMKIEDDVLTVTVSQKWLDAATYPVVVDPTFGYTSIGGSNTSVNANYLRGTRGTGAAGQVQSITVYSNEGIAATFKGILVKVSDLNIITNGITSAGNIPNPAAWGTATYSTSPTITSQDYYICIISGSGISKVFYDTVASQGFADNTNSFASPTNPTDGSATNFKWSIYATYYTETVSSPTITDLNDGNNLYAMKTYYTFNATTTHSLGASNITAASMKLTNSTGDLIAQVKVTGLDGGAPTWSITSGSAYIDLDTASCSWTENGNVGTAIFKIRAEWDYPAETLYDLSASFLDDYAYNTTWTTATDYVDVITRLVTRDFGGNVTSTTVSSGIGFTGLVRYASTPTGDNATTSYPPNAEFTDVKIYTGESEYVGIDTTIVNGAFSVSGTSSPTLGTTFYYVWLDMEGDYTDGLAPDADYVAIGTVANFTIIEIVNQGFAYWGITFATANAVITAFAVWFTDSATALISLVSSVFTLLIYMITAITGWITRISSFFVTLFTIINSIIDGSYSGGTNWWTAFNVSAWLDVVPVFAFIFWFDSLPKRAKRMGVNTLEVAIRDLQIATYIVGEVWGWTFTLFSFVVNSVMTFVGVVTG